jgi:hypothetical protein
MLYAYIPIDKRPRPFVVSPPSSTGRTQQQTTSGNQWSREALLMSQFHAPAVFCFIFHFIFTLAKWEGWGGGNGLEDELNNIRFVIYYLCIIVLLLSIYSSHTGIIKGKGLEGDSF